MVYVYRGKDWLRGQNGAAALAAEWELYTHLNTQANREYAFCPNVYATGRPPRDQTGAWRQRIDQRRNHHALEAAA